MSKREVALSKLVAEALGESALTPDQLKAAALRREADKLTKEVLRAMEWVVPGQPVLSTRDRNYRDKLRQKQEKASDLIRQAEQLEANQ